MKATNKETSKYFNIKRERFEFTELELEALILKETNKRILEELEDVLKFNMELRDDNKFMSIMNTSNLQLARRIQKLKDKN
jgi:hypothetical protein